MNKQIRISSKENIVIVIGRSVVFLGGLFFNDFEFVLADINLVEVKGVVIFGLFLFNLLLIDFVDCFFPSSFLGLDLWGFSDFICFLLVVDLFESGLIFYC